MDLSSTKRNKFEDVLHMMDFPISPPSRCPPGTFYAGLIEGTILNIVCFSLLVLCWTPPSYLKVKGWVVGEGGIQDFYASPSTF